MDIVTFEGSMAATAATRLRVGPVFYPGNYGAKGTYTEADMDTIAAQFNVFGVNVEHRKSVLDGKIGTVTRMWPDTDDKGRKALFAEWDQPEPLALLLGEGPVPVSIELHKGTKKPVGMALSKTPHVTDAAFFSAVEDAYVAFSKGEEVVPFAYESTDERDLISSEDFGDPGNKLFPVRTPSEYRESIREIAYAEDPTYVRDRINAIAERKGFKSEVYPWYQTTGVSRPMSEGSDSALSMYSRKEQKMEKTFWQKFAEFMGGAKPEEVEQFSAAMSAGAVGFSATTPATATAPVDAEKEAALAELKAIKEAQEATRIASFGLDATARADKLVEAKVIAAKGNEDYANAVAAFTVAARYDAERADLAYFGATEPAAKFSMVEYLERLSGKSATVQNGELVGDLPPDVFAVFEQEHTSGGESDVNKLIADATKAVIAENLKKAGIVSDK